MKDARTLCKDKLSYPTDRRHKIIIYVYSRLMLMKGIHFPTYWVLTSAMVLHFKISFRCFGEEIYFLVNLKKTLSRLHSFDYQISWLELGWRCLSDKHLIRWATDKTENYSMHMTAFLWIGEGSCRWQEEYWGLISCMLLVSSSRGE